MTSAGQKVAKKIRRGLIGVAGFSALTNLLMLTAPLYTMLVFDKVLSSGQPATLVYLTLIALAALAALGLLEAVRARLLARLGTELEHRLAPDLLQATLDSTLKGSPASTEPMRDLSTVRGFLAGAQVTALLDAPWVPVFVVVLALLHPLLGLLGLAAAVLLFAVAVANELLTRRPLALAARAQLAGTMRLERALRNADAIKAMGMEAAVRTRWSGEHDRALAGQLQAADLGAGVTGASRFLRLVAQIGVLGLGAWLVLQNQLTAGGMIAGSILLGRALAPVEQSLAGWRSLVAARGAWRRLSALMRFAPPAPERMRLPEPEGRLSLEDVWYAPSGRDEPTLAGVSFALAPGEALGVIGPSGAGKSTLCKLLIGVWPAARGAVRLDGAELAHWDPAQIGRHLGYLPQDVELFDGSVRDNIARMDDRADPDAIVAAAKAAGIHEFALSLPEGYDTEIGPSGSHLSGGQRQRIGLARALYGRPRLIVLDEPHASLDGAGEKDLLAAVEAAKAWGAVVIVVAHRPAILEPCDKLMILQGGRVYALGARDAILAQIKGPATTPGTTRREIGPPERALEGEPTDDVAQPDAFKASAAAVVRRAGARRRARLAGEPRPALAAGGER